MRLPPSSVGIDAHTLLPITPQRGTRPGVSGGSTPRFTPSTVTSPVTLRRTTMVSSGGSATSPLAMRRASAKASIASESFGELRSANPINAYEITIVIATATTIVAPSLPRIVGSRSSGRELTTVPGTRTRRRARCG